jgi:hypothetical protein
MVWHLLLEFLLPEGKCLALKRLVQVFINDEWLLLLTQQWHEPHL